MMAATRGKGKNKANTKTRAKGNAKSRFLGGGDTDDGSVVMNSETDGGRGGMSMHTLILAVFLLLTVFAIGFAVAYFFMGRKQVIQRVIVPLQQGQGPSSSSPPSPPAPPVYPTKLPEYPLRHQRSSFQQVGALVLSDNDSKEPVILPLFGRKLSNRDRWEYYCASDKFHMTRLPVRFGNRDCEDDVGCDEIFNGQEVTVPDYGNKTFTARMYKYNVPRYN